MGQAGVVTLVASVHVAPLGSPGLGSMKDAPCGHQQDTVLQFPTPPSSRTHPAGGTLCPRMKQLRFNTKHTRRNPSAP